MRASTRQIIRDAELHVTRPRILILDLLRAAGGHHSVEEIGAMLTEAGTPLPKATLYNVVEVLVEAGILMQADHGPGKAVYEYAERWHHHFVCRRCGVIIDVPCVVGEKPCLHPDLPDAHEVDEAQIIFRGLCPTCASSAGRRSAGG